MQVATISWTIILMAAFLAAMAGNASAHSTISCVIPLRQPQEGTGFLIVNGAKAAASSPYPWDCYDNVANPSPGPPPDTIATGQVWTTYSGEDW